MKKGSAEEVRPEEDIFTKPYAKIDEIIQKKSRNLEKRKQRLLSLEETEKKGGKLTEEQVLALSKIGDVDTQIEFVKEMLKTIMTLNKDFNRAKKQREEAARREQAERERKSLADFIRYQKSLSILGNEEAKKMFIDGSNGAVKLEEEEFHILDFLNDCFNPSLEDSMSNSDWEAKCEKSASHGHAILHGTKEKVFEKRTGSNVKEFLEKVASCEYAQELIANQFATEEEPVKDEKPLEVEDSLQKEDPKVVFVQGDGEASKEHSESDAVEATTTEFGYEGYTMPVETNANEVLPVDSVPKSDSHNLAAGDQVEYGISNVKSEAPVPWAPASNSEVKPEKLAEGNENVFLEGSVPNRTERRPPRGGYRGGNRYRDNMSREGFDRRRVSKDGRQRNFDNAYGKRGSGRGGRGPGRGGFPRGGGNRFQNNHMNDLTNGYDIGGHYSSKYSYNDANPPRRSGLNFASDIGNENRK